MKSKKKKESMIELTMGRNYPKYVVDWHKKYIPDATIIDYSEGAE